LTPGLFGPDRRRAGWLVKKPDAGWGRTVRRSGAGAWNMIPGRLIEGPGAGFFLISGGGGGGGFAGPPPNSGATGC